MAPLLQFARLCATFLILYLLALIPAQAQNIEYTSVIITDTSGKNAFSADFARDTSVYLAALSTTRSDRKHWYFSTESPGFDITRYPSITVNAIELYALPAVGYSGTSANPGLTSAYFLYECPSGELLLAGVATNVLGNVIVVGSDVTGLYSNVAVDNGSLMNLYSAFDETLRADSEAWRIYEACGDDRIVDATID